MLWLLSELFLDISAGLGALDARCRGYVAAIVTGRVSFVYLRPVLVAHRNENHCAFQPSHFGTLCVELRDVSDSPAQHFHRNVITVGLLLLQAATLYRARSTWYRLSASMPVMAPNTFSDTEQMCVRTLIQKLVRNLFLSDYSRRVGATNGERRHTGLTNALNTYLA